MGARRRPLAPPPDADTAPAGKRDPAMLGFLDIITALVAAPGWEGRDPTLRQMSALLLIYSRDAPYSVGELALRLRIPDYAMTRVCNWLEARDAIRREIHRADRRTVLLLRTPRGTRLCAAIAGHCQRTARMAA